jgi:hypothetical protein
MAGRYGLLAKKPAATKGCCAATILYSRGGNMTQRLGYLGRPSLPSKSCTHQTRSSSSSHSVSLF